MVRATLIGFSLFFGIAFQISGLMSPRPVHSLGTDSGQPDPVRPTPVFGGGIAAVSPTSRSDPNSDTSRVLANEFPLPRTLFGRAVTNNVGEGMMAIGALRIVSAPGHGPIVIDNMGCVNTIAAARAGGHPCCPGDQLLLYQLL